jgi:DNA repair exonuclease SbcCD nuclease subunit
VTVIRIVHTADVHLDRCYAATGGSAAFGNRRRQALRDVLQGTVRRAAEWPADALLIAGDLFEQDRVTRDTIAFLRQLFESAAPLRVFIAPGNHDPASPGSPYRTDPWPGNVTIFAAPEWSCAQVDGTLLAVHGFGFDGPEISRNPFGHLTIPNDGRIHVAVGHGSEMGALPANKGAYAPFRAEQAAPDGLVYLALGHYHGMKQISGPFRTHMCYSGAPEGHDFGEPGPHYHLEVTIDGEQVRVETAISCRTIYTVHQLDCTSFETSQQVVDSVRALALGNPQAEIARVTLAGAPIAPWRHEIPAIRDALAPNFERLDLIDALETAEDFDAIAHDGTALGTFVARVTEELRDTTDPARRKVLERAREVGLAGFRGVPMTVRGLNTS